MGAARANYIGTSGWSYPSGYGKWNGIVYPKRWRGDELAYYAERFPAVEVNVSFYRLPAIDTVRGWVARTPKTFRFAVKLYRKFTHPDFYAREEGKSPEITADDVLAMRHVLDPLAEEERLGALLVQYPESFSKTPSATSALVRTLDAFRDYPLAVELRHASWDDAQSAEVLDHFTAARVRIDEPFYRNLDAPPTPHAALEYWRFHGRNKAAWRNPEMAAKRYDYHYNPQEIDELVDAILQQPDAKYNRFVFFNNHVSGQAAANAIAMAVHLGIDLPYPKFAHLSDRFPELRPITGPAGGQFSLLD